VQHCRWRDGTTPPSSLRICDISLSSGTQKRRRRRLRDDDDKTFRRLLGTRPSQGLFSLPFRRSLLLNLYRSPRCTESSDGRSPLGLELCGVDCNTRADSFFLLGGDVEIYPSWVDGDMASVWRPLRVASWMSFHHRRSSPL